MNTQIIDIPASVESREYPESAEHYFGNLLSCVSAIIRLRQTGLSFEEIDSQAHAKDSLHANIAGLKNHLSSFSPEEQIQVQQLCSLALEAPTTIDSYYLVRLEQCSQACEAFIRPKAFAGLID